jgi:hypothetical protein
MVIKDIVGYALRSVKRIVLSGLIGMPILLPRQHRGQHLDDEGRQGDRACACTILIVLIDRGSCHGDLAARKGKAPAAGRL